MKNQPKVLKVILNTELVKINDLGTEYQVLIALSSQAGVIEHEPFKHDLQGLVSAMQLATEICAGKFFPRRVIQNLDFDVAAPIQIEAKRK